MVHANTTRDLSLNVNDNQDPDSEERTPLLREVSARTPLPRLQLGIVLAFLLAEPITIQCISPFLNAFVRALDVTGGDDRKVGYYAGIIQSLFFLGEGCMVLHWSRLSDRVGRKPILLLGIFALSVSMISFGLSTTFWAAAASRCLGGMLNGNIGVVKSMMAELTDSTNMAKAVALLPIVYAVGGTIGPLIGGTFSKPHERFPDMFSGPFWAQHQYFLPCLITAILLLIALVTAAASLKETVKTVKATSPLLTISDDTECQTIEEVPPLRKLLTRPVVIAILNHNLFSLLDITMLSIFPLFCYTPIEHGGLGLEPAMIGYLLGTRGVVSGIFQVVAFEKCVDMWGEKKLFSLAMAFFVPWFGLYPVVNYLARERGLDVVTWAFVSIQLVFVTAMDMAWGCIFMYITAAAPPKTLGATNGVAQTMADIWRVLGPAFATALFAFSIERQVLGGNLVYVVLASFAAMAFCATRLLPERV